MRFLDERGGIADFISVERDDGEFVGVIRLSVDELPHFMPAKQTELTTAEDMEICGQLAQLSGG